SPDKTEVQSSAVWSATGVKAGGHINLALVLDIQKPYHINSDKAKDPFVPTSIQLLPGADSLICSTPIFPNPNEIEFGAGAVKERIKVFSGRLVAYLPMTVLESAKPGKQELHVRIAYQACDDHKCLFPTEVTQSAELNVVGATEDIQNINSELFEPLSALSDRLRIPFFGLDFEIAPSKLWLLLIVAAVGG